MTFLKEKLTNRDLLTKCIKSKRNSIEDNDHLFHKIKASDYQWKLFYENILLYGGALCLLLGLVSISVFLLSMVDFDTRLIILSAFISVLILASFIIRKKKVLSLSMVVLAMIGLGFILFLLGYKYYSITFVLQLLIFYLCALLVAAVYTKFKPLYYASIIVVDALLLISFISLFLMADYDAAYLLVMINATLLGSFLYINYKYPKEKLIPNWFIGLCLFTFNSFNLYYLYLVNGYLSSVWNISCILLNLLLMLLYLYLFNYLKNFLNYTIVVLTCFFGAFLTLFKFSTTLYSYVLCTALLIIALNSFVKYLVNIQIRWKSLRN